MKTVYCDIVFAANFFSDFALLYLCARFLQLKPSKIRILISSVMACEMINTSVEAVVDLVTTKENPLAKIAKDCGSSASLILSFASLICGVIIFLPKILALF